MLQRENGSEYCKHLQHFGSQIMNHIPKKTSELENDSHFVSTNNIPDLPSVDMLNDSCKLIVIVDGVEYKMDLIQLLQYMRGDEVVGNINDNNEIILNDNLAEGTYTLRYEDAHGNIINNYTAITESYTK